MSRRTPHSCIDPQCSRCSDMEAAAWVEREFPEPLSRGEEARLDDWAERQMEANWP